MLMLLAGFVLHVLFYIYKGKQDQKKVRSATPRHSTPNPTPFDQEAQSIGFSPPEVKILNQIAAKDKNASAAQILETPQGRLQLLERIGKNIQRREREVEILHHMEGLLKGMDDHQFQQRQYMRLKIDGPVEVSPQLAAPGPSQQDDRVFVEAESTPGRLIDLGEGGAALSAELDLETGDILELSFRDERLPLPKLTAIIVGKENKEDGLPVFHTHFLDPPQAPIRRVIVQLQRQFVQQAQQMAERDDDTAPPPTVSEKIEP